MLHAYKPLPRGLARLGQQSPTEIGVDLEQAFWIDLYRPLDSQVAAVAALPGHDGLAEVLHQRLWHAPCAAGPPVQHQGQGRVLVDVVGRGE